MEKVLDKFETIISTILLLVAMFIVSFQTLELIWELITSFITRIKEVGLEYRPEYTQTVVVLFFSILLTLEIIETIKVFRHDHQAKIEIILIVVMIAISRKILAMDTQGSHVEEELATAALIVAFSLSYFLVRIRNKRNSAKIKANPKTISNHKNPVKNEK
jgi:uncharacterized membrane protein (DUF373 family)